MQPKILSLASAVGIIGAQLLAPLQIQPSSAAPLSEIKERGYLIVAVKDNLRPLGFRDASGNLQGLEIDLARRLAKEILGSEEAVKFQPVANQERLAAVLTDKVDVAIARLTSTPSRARLVNFSIPYYLDGTAIVTNNPSLQKLGDLTLARIAVLRGASTIAVIRSAFPRAQLIGADSYQQAQELLANGKAEAFAADASVLSGWVQEYPQYRLLAALLSTEALAAVTPKGLQYADLQAEIDSAIARAKATGWLPERAAYWGLPNY